MKLETQMLSSNQKTERSRQRTCGISSGTRPIQESDRMQQSPAVLDDFSQCRCILSRQRPLTSKAKHNRDHDIHSQSPSISLLGHEVRLRLGSSSEAVWYSSTLCPRSDVHTLFPLLPTDAASFDTAATAQSPSLPPSLSLAWMAKPEKVAQLEGRRRRRCRCCWNPSSRWLMNSTILILALFVVHI